MTAISVGCPGYPEFVTDFCGELQRFRDIRGPHATEDHPFAIFPEDNGILPLALDENDVWFCWVTKGPPDEWPILIRWTWGSEGMKVFDLPLPDLLVALFERKIELPCFPLPTFVDDVQFLPYEAGKTIGGNRVVPQLSASTVEVVNRGEVVGMLTDLAPDMWHLEGRLTPATTVAGERFVETASAIDLGRAYQAFVRCSADRQKKRGHCLSSCRCRKAGYLAAVSSSRRPSGPARTLG